METGSPELPPAPLAGDAPQTAAEVRLPWSTLLHALPCGVAAGLLIDLALCLMVRPSQAPTASDLLESSALYLAVVEVACLALVLGEGVPVRAARWLRWAVALGLVSVLSELSFDVHAVRWSPAPRLMLWTVLLTTGGTALGTAAAGGTLGWAAGARSGLLWRLPLAAVVAALVRSVPHAATSLPALVHPRYGHTSRTMLGMGYAMDAPVLMAVALAVALGLRAARVGRTRGSAPTTASPA
ncbi:MAG: hypothetical protein FJ313_06330, partial [Gemmatimonadetes bacterium]|nr:hypothetical protein [Gemmatimonadota bacterium]